MDFKAIENGWLVDYLFVVVSRINVEIIIRIIRRTKSDFSKNGIYIYRDTHTHGNESISPFFFLFF